LNANQRFLRSYDKQVSPTGINNNHLIKPDTKLNFVIRFQNTGTDTTYAITITDTLSNNFDISTLQKQASSHPFTFDISGKGSPVLTWSITGINLPDSLHNNLGSQGFVSFSISPKKDLPENTVINNFADIFFDYNKPVRTNVTYQTVSSKEIIDQNQFERKSLQVFKPSITYITPQSTNSIGTITISGENYAPVFSDNTVTLDGKKVDVISGNTTSLTISWPNNFKTGEVTVTTEGGTAKSNVDFVLGTESVLNSSIKVYPNPTNGKFIIENSDGIIKSIQVSDVLGKNIYKQIFKNNTQSSQINLSEANAGMYVIFIETDMGTTTKKLIIK